MFSSELSHGTSDLSHGTSDLSHGVTEPSATNAGELLLEVTDLTKHFGPVQAVDGLSFTVRRGEIVGLLGPNGAGKTTVMRMLVGYLIPSRGSV